MNLKLIPFVLTLFLAPAVLAQDYEIKLDRPKKAGQEYKIEAKVNLLQDTSVTSDGKPVKIEKQNITGRCTGVLKIVEMDANGRETKISLTITKFTRADGDVESEALPKGAVVTSSVTDGKTTHEVDGKPASPEIAELLDSVMGIGKDGKGNDEAIFGTKERKKKGDSWDVNTDLAKKDFAQSSNGGNLENPTGKSTLDDVTGDALKISGHITGSAPPHLSPKFTVDTSAFDTSFSGTYPIDITKTPTDESQNVTVAFTAHATSPKGEKIELNVKMGTSLTRNLTLLK